MKRWIVSASEGVSMTKIVSSNGHIDDLSMMGCVLPVRKAAKV